MKKRHKIAVGEAALDSERKSEAKAILDEQEIKEENECRYFNL